MSQPTQPRYDCLACGARYVLKDHTCLAANGPQVVESVGPIKPAVGDTESQEKGSGARFNNDKVPYEYIPLHLLAEAAEVFHLVTTRKINPYPMWNWAKGMPWLVPYACLCRHAAAWFCGEEFDIGPAGSGKRHTAHMMCNLLMIIHYEQTYPEGDNRPKKWFGKEKQDAGA